MSADLPVFVQNLLSPVVAAELPDYWQGEYSIERASEWIAERDSESSVLIAKISSNSPVGLLILYPYGQQVRIGYLLSEDHWGKGFATELLSGFIDWCTKSKVFDEVIAGVASSNVASIRVLEKCGFVRKASDEMSSELMFIHELEVV
jgi:RimJ/RimL family protein N-acetyltransferase